MPGNLVHGGEGYGTRHPGDRRVSHSKILIHIVSVRGTKYLFARLTLRDGKPRYLADTPRFIAYIRATASRYRELTPLLALIDQAEGTQPTAAYMFGRA